MIFYKDEDDKRIVTLNWTSWLGVSTITSVAWEETTGTITISNTSNTTTTATAYLSGGSNGVDYFIKCTITTADTVARIESRTFTLKVLRKEQ